MPNSSRKLAVVASGITCPITRKIFLNSDTIYPNHTARQKLCGLAKLHFLTPQPHIDFDLFAIRISIPLNDFKRCAAAAYANFIAHVSRTANTYARAIG